MGEAPRRPDRALVRRRARALGRPDAAASRRALRRRPGAALAGGRRASVGRHRAVSPRHPLGELHVLVPDADPTARSRDSAHGRGARAVGVRPDLRRVVGTRGARRRQERDQALRGALRSGSRLSLRHSRSPLASRNASDSSGSAGRPPRSRQTARTIVRPNDAVINSHVRRTRSLNCAAAARKSAKNSMSGIPRFAVLFSPGTGNANDRRSNTPAWWWTIVFVGPRQTEYASTHGMISATMTTHDASSKKSRNSQPANVAAPSFENDAGASQVRNEKPIASAMKTSTASQRQRQR